MAARAQQLRQEPSAGEAGAKGYQHLCCLHFQSGPIAKASCPPRSQRCMPLDYQGHWQLYFMSSFVKAARNLITTCAAAATFGAALAPSNALAVTTWSWSFTTNIPSQFASGTLTTADVIPTTGTTYHITGISGTYNRGGTSYAITSLNTNDENKFQLSSVPSSPILTDYYFYIGFYADGKSVRFANIIAPQYAAVNRTTTTFSGSDGDIVSSSIAPYSPPSTEVPGPLPLLGAAAAFQASRRLRRRLNGSLPAA